MVSIRLFSYPLYSSLKAPWSEQVHKDADIADPPYTRQSIPAPVKAGLGWSWGGTKVALVSISVANQPQTTSDNFLPHSEPQISPMNGLGWTRGSLQSR